MSKRYILSVFLLATFLLVIFSDAGSDGVMTAEADGQRTITADVVALDQPFYYNRLGAINANGMMYALQRDVVSNIAVTGVSTTIAAGDSLRDIDLDELQSGSSTDTIGDALAGNVSLRADKRPRPIVLRVNEGDKLQINFTNLLDPQGLIFNLPGDFPTGQILGLCDIDVDPDAAGKQCIKPKIDDQPLTRVASVHIDGLSLVGDLGSDGSNVGQNPAVLNGLVGPGESTTYTYYAPNEATHLMYSMGTILGAEGNGGTRSYGLFGAVNVQKAGAEWYRSQLTREEMDWAASAWQSDGAGGFMPSQDNLPTGPLRTTLDGQPILNYNAVYPNTAGAGKAGLPIVAMLNGNELVHTDINAIITGPNKGRFPDWTYQDNLAAGDRNAPYREFTVIFHDEAFGVQAFPAFYNDPVLKHTLHGVRDSFPINYGSGGIGSEIIANRLGVGPMWDCTECKYEEFFLASSVVGDPAMIVDIPANTTDVAGNIISGAKATKALYPEDPSNVHHSYLSDRVKFRNLHAGPKEHHIFHLHAHQWLFNPDDPQSNYLDGQAIGPGSGYTYEIAYGGSGNRNKTAGDSIFHCHFYPHFAQGMWEMWRVHDVFEQGTRMDIDLDDGLPIPAAGSRALPDGEIAAGTPIPGLVPIPTNAMAPMPDAATTVVASDLNNDTIADSSQFDANGDGTADIFQVNDSTAAPATNPGYPWYIPTLMGHRPPTPALDMDPEGDGSSAGFDGGLPRHIVTSGPDEDNPGHVGGPIEMYVSRLDFNKVLHEASAIQIPEGGTPVEQVAMAFHAQQFHPSFKPDGTAAQFETNGLPPAPGAPYAEPCRTDPAADGTVSQIPLNRTIKGANIEMPIVLNKVGWHFQQQRFEALWEDVIPTLTNARAPQPMIMRMNSTDCGQFWHTNLVPNVYQLDDYQVRTPTDIIGQHIHLVKFDVTAADGSANGFNYEDGTLSPDEVSERIHAFNNGGGLDGNTNIQAEHHPYFSDPARVPNYVCEDANHQAISCNSPDVEKAGPDFDGDDLPDQNWFGARTTIQRWYADPLLERSWDGGVGTVFTHDHYGPSTHQQVGLYSTLLVEPEGSVWLHNEEGYKLGEREDGGSSGWQAIIMDCQDALVLGMVNLCPESAADFKAHREFYFEFADFQHAYEEGGGALGELPNEQIPALAGLWPEINIPSYADFDDAINPSFRLPPPVPEDIFFHPNACRGPAPGQVNLPRPCPEAISADDPGTYALNFRNEPIGLRVFNGQLGAGAGQTPGLAGDLAFAYQSRTDRVIAELNSQPAGPYPPLTADVQPGDPWTPLLRVYMGDKVRIRVQVGAHEEEHNFTIPGLKWRQEPNSENSGWKNSEFFGIDEYFNLDVPIVPDTTSGTPARVDYVYTVGAELEGMWNGVWGILRSYGSQRGDLYELPDNNVGKNGYTITNEADFDGICPLTAPLTSFDVTAVRAIDVVGPQGIVYNDRTTLLTPPLGGIAGQGPLIDPTALMYVLNDDLVYDANGNPAGLKPGVPVEPLVLRVNAGDCVQVNLTNALPADLSSTEMPGFNSLPPIVHKDENVNGIGGNGGITSFNANDITPSSHVGLTPQLLAFDPRTDGGFSTGLTTGKLVAPDTSESYTWYAGDVTVTNDNCKGSRTCFTLAAEPVEFGAAGLMPADRIKGTENGLVGAIIVEPQDSCWIADPGTRAQATVWKDATDANGDGMIGACASTPAGSTDSFRDFVTVMQNDINLRYGGGNCANNSSIACAVPNIGAEGPLGPPEDPQDSGHKAINYGADPLWFRLGITPDTPFGTIHRNGTLKDLIPDVFSNSLSGVGGDPQTEVYRASPNGPAYGRFRVVMPGGHARGVEYTIHGHEWQRQPYVNRSTEIGNNPISGYYGTQEGINPTGHWDFIVKLGGHDKTEGDYLWRDQASFGSYMGLWGLLRFDYTPPVVADAAYTLPKYTSIDIDLLSGVFDLDGLAGATVTITPGGPIFGNLTDPDGDGVYTYESTAWPEGCGDPFVCIDSFTYTVTDAPVPPNTDGLESNTGMVTLFITNTAPQANHDTIIIKDPDTSGSVDVLLNDFDAEGDVANGRINLVDVQAALDPNGVGGTVSLAGSTVRYSGPFSAAGVVVIPYTITDESGAESNVASIRVAVNVDDITITEARYQPQNGNWTISGTCTDPFHLDGQTPTTITIYFGNSIMGDPPVIGKVNCEASDPVGTWRFSGTSTAPPPDPDAENFVSAQSDFVNGGGGFSEAFPVSFAGQNNAPVAKDDSYTIDEDEVLNGNVLADNGNGPDIDADFDMLTAVLVSDVSNGTLVLNDDGSFTYTPNANYHGPPDSPADSFTYQADDGKELSNVATVFITILAVNDAPVVTITVPADGATFDTDDLITFSGTAIDPDDGSNVSANLEWTDNGNPLGSGASFQVSLIEGSHTITAKVADSVTPSLIGSASINLTIVAAGQNQPPVAVNDGYTMAQNGTLTVAVSGPLGLGVLANDTDADNNLLSVSEVNGLAANVGVEITLASGATLTLNGDGSFTYTPTFNFIGTDSFTYVANDDTVDSNEATVTITVEDVVTVTDATYRARQDRWNVQGTVSNATSSVDVYLNSVAPENWIGTASVDEITGDWSFTSTGALGAVDGDTVIAVSSGGGVSEAFPVSVRGERR